MRLRTFTLKSIAGKTGRLAGLFFSKSTQNDVITAWFGALCFFLSTIEYMIPKPLPFLRLGLANIPMLLVIDILPFPAYCLLILLKILGQGLIGGTLFSYIFIFSAAGSISSALAMLFLKKVLRSHISWIGVSVAGAFTSNFAQLFLARYYIFGESAWVIMPVFVAVGTITGVLLGIFANRFAKKSAWYADLRKGNIALIVPGARKAGMDGMTGQGATEQSTKAAANHPFRLACGLILIITLLFVDNLIVQCLIVLMSVILVLSDSSTIKLLPAVIMSASIILFNLFVPFGKVLAEPFGLPITEGALLLGIKKALIIEGMVFISRWMLKDGLKLPGKIGTLVSQAFDILGSLSANRKKLDPKNLIHSIDEIMYGRG